MPAELAHPHGNVERFYRTLGAGHWERSAQHSAQRNGSRRDIVGIITARYRKVLTPTAMLGTADPQAARAPLRLAGARLRGLRRMAGRHRTPQPLSNAPPLLSQDQEDGQARAHDGLIRTTDPHVPRTPPLSGTKLEPPGSRANEPATLPGLG